MKQDTSSAEADAALCKMGSGINGRDDRFRVGFAFSSKDLTASYVVKNAPEEGIVIRITLPTP